MRVAVVAPTEIPSRRANSIQVMKMAQALVKLGFTVRLTAPRPSPPGAAGVSPPTWEYLQQHYGLQCSFAIEWLSAKPALRRYDYGWQAVRWARSWQADVLYTRLPQAAALASQSDLPTILEVHDMPQGFWGPQLFRWFMRGKGARRLVVITSALAQDLERFFGVAVQPPFTMIASDGVDLERYANLPDPVEARKQLLQTANGITEAMLPPERFTAGYTGHLYAGRGVELLLELARRLPEITFLLVGGEPQEVARLRSQTLAERLNNIILTGFIPNEKLPVYQAACEVLLMPYQRRVTASSGGDIARYLSPMKVFEYLACGRAILSSDLPVLQEALNSENAVLLPSQDVDAWMLALQRLRDLPDKRLRLARRARQDAAQYTWEARAARIFDLQI